MTRVFGHYVSFEMLLLGLLEAGLWFAAFQLLLLPEATHTGIVMYLAFLLTGVVSLTALAIGLYRPSICLQPRRLVMGALVGALVAYPAALVAVMMGGDARMVGPGFDPGLYGLLAIVVLWAIWLLLVRLSLGLLAQLDLFATHVMAIDAGFPGARERSVLAAIEAAPFLRLVGSRSAGNLPAPEELRRQRVRLLVVIGSARTAAAPEWLLACKCAGVRVMNDREFCERYLRRVDIDGLRPDWLAFAEGFSCEPTALLGRRLVDIVLSSALLLFTLPLMAVAALLIVAESPGPAFYLQERVGQGGRVFRLIKFRSMRQDAEAQSGPTWAVRNDCRVTRVGRFIRLARIDELPQLFNVLKGDMSFIGPRPERPHFVAQLAAQIPAYDTRSYVKPGITGWAQVNYPYGASVEDARMKLAYDLYYLKHRSLFLDLLILLATVRVVLLQEGAR